MIRIDQEPGIAHLRLSRPEKKNALTRAMYETLVGAIRDAAADESVHAIVISGDGGVFTAGNDLEDFRARATAANPQPSAGLAFIAELIDCDTPVIAAVEGLAIGIGTTLLLHCDLVIAGHSARFKTAFVDLGLVPEAASTVAMPLHLGARRTAELLLMGDTLSGDQARDCGLISQAVADGAALDEALNRARHLVARPRGALLASKRLIRAPWRPMLKEALERERPVFAERLRSPDCLAALSGFARR